MSVEQKMNFTQTGNLTSGNRLQDIDIISVQSTQDRANALDSGHRACQGCGEALGARYAIDKVMELSNNKVHVVNATGCLEVFTTPFPETSWNVPWLHSLFGNAPAVATGFLAVCCWPPAHRRRREAESGSSWRATAGLLSAIFRCPHLVSPCRPCCCCT